MKSKFIFFTLLGLGAVYAAMAFDRQKKLYDKSKFRISAYNIEQLEWDYAKIKLFFEISNYMDIDITILRQAYNIYINRKFITKLTHNNLKLPSGSTKVIEKTIEFDPSMVVAEALSSLFSGFKNLSLTIRGSLTAYSSLIITKLPVDITYRIGDLAQK